MRSLVWRGGKLLKAVLSGKGPSSLDYDLQVGVPHYWVDVQLRSGAFPEALCWMCNPQSNRDGSDGKRFLSRR